MRRDTSLDELWRGRWGYNYHTGRGRANMRIAGRERLLREALGEMPIDSAVEFGAGDGPNLQVLRDAFGTQRLEGVEINPEACSRLSRVAVARQMSVFDWTPPKDPFDLALTMGFLIHIHPDQIAETYSKLAAAGRWVLMAEYFEETRRSDPDYYRGSPYGLSRAPFGVEFLDTCPGFKLSRQGFVASPLLDNLTWWLFRAKS